MDNQAKSRPANRRRSLRKSPRTSVKVECRKGATGLGPNLTQLVLDFSDTGVRMTVSQSIDVLAEVEITLSGYGMSKPIKRLGNVRWQLKLENGTFCVGIEFQKHLAYKDWLNLAVPG
ncbi:MAG: PilZ domain-containing protein [Planctomycetes bacterium]|jgi:hypothetical protein|nr:PilZ domain-containing protein [Planctomycetota bacterium]